jgi:hypothetical protein
MKLYVMLLYGMLALGFALLLYVRLGGNIHILAVGK